MTSAAASSWAGWMVLPLRRYFDFRGRSGRREFWWYCLGLFLAYAAVFCVAVVVAIAGDEAAPEKPIGAIVAIGWGAVFLLNVIPGLALTTRRLHDMGLTGVMIAAIFVALLVLNFIAWVAYFIWMSLPGQTSPNRWGPPLGSGDVADVFA
jgi:uncharacterized membrane protein YhaH (DUF805 family)